MKPIQLQDLTYCTKNTNELTVVEQSLVAQLFFDNYRHGNLNYLKASLAALRKISIAADGERVVGFSLADSISMALPRMKNSQVVVLGGMGCIDSQYRRMGLFSRLASLAGGNLGEILDGRIRLLACARIAHPASFRTLRRLPSALPNSSSVLSDWQLEVGAAVANHYGVELKPDSLIIQGDGKPIGYPNIAVDVSDEEWRPFEGVNRDEGDSLLGLAWAPDPPEGWF